MSGYTPTGPFTNGGAPGIAAAFLNNLEAVIQQLEGDTGATTITGGTSGTAIHYEVLQGTVKMIFISEASFRTGGSNQDWTLPVAFTLGCMFWCTDVDTWHFMNGGGTSNSDNLNAVSATGGSAISEGNVFAWCQGAFVHPFDTIRHNSGAGGSHTGYIFIVGV